MRTIIQHIGPLYGEANKGTVFGQPNGSIAIVNGIDKSVVINEIWKIAFVETVSGKAVKFNGIATGSEGTYGPYSVIGKYNFVTVTGSSSTKNFLSASLLQDIEDTGSVMRVEISTEEDFSTIFVSASAGSGEYTTVPSIALGSKRITTGTTYYIRLALYDSAGNYLEKYSNTITTVGV